MSLILHVSDLHFGTERPSVVAALQVLARAQLPSLIVVSGDITQRARSGEFRAAAEFVKNLGIAPSVTIPGNHDIPLFNWVARLCFPYAGFVREFGATLEPEYESPSMLVVGVNTTRRTRHIDGEVSHAQIARVAQRLSGATAAQLRIVVTHQPVHVTQASDLKNLLRGHEPAVRAWSAAGADLILGGHIHLPYVSPLFDVTTTLQRRIWAVQAGTALSTRTRRGIPNSVNLIRRASQELNACAVERWDYRAESDAFERVKVTGLQLDRR